MATIADTPNFQNEIANTIASKFEISDKFLKDIAKKTLGILKKSKKPDLVQYLKEGGLPDVVANIVQPRFKKTARSAQTTETPETVKQPTSSSTNNLLKVQIDGITREGYANIQRFLPPVLKKLGLADLFNKKPFKAPEIVEKIIDKKIPETVTPRKDDTKTVASNSDQQGDIYEREPPKFLLAGITEEGKNNLKKNLPEIFSEILEPLLKKITKKEEKGDDRSFRERFREGGLLGLLPKALLPILGGASLILGGLAALVGAFMTQGPAKGTLELIGKVGLKGGLTMLAKKLFTKSLEKVLSKIPIIGSLISFGFAIQRFYNGDKIGGILEIASGIANLFPGVGTVISLGIDILQAVLDAKAGGSSAEASAKKSGILLDWAKGLGSLLYKGIKYVPVIGPLIQATEDMINGKWLDATYNLIRAIPGVGIVIDVLDWFTGGKTQETIKGGIVNVSKWITGMTKWFVEKVKDLPFISSLLRFGEHFNKGEYLEALKSLGHSIPFLGGLLDWLGMKETNAAGETIDDTNLQNTFNLLIKLKDWVKETIINKITSWASSVYNWGKEKLTKLSSSLGFGNNDIPKQPTVPDTKSQMYRPKEELMSAKDAVNTPTPMKDGGVIPATPGGKVIRVAEAGKAEVITPIDKYMKSFEGFDNSILEKIASNTGSTNDGFKMLSQAILKLAQTFDKKNTASNNNIFVNGQQQQIPSASQIAATNVDPISQIRMQFAV